MLALALFTRHTPRNGKRTPITMWTTVFAVGGATVAWIATLYLFAFSALLNRGFIIPAAAVMAVLATGTRLLAARLLPRQAFQERLLLIGNGEQARLLVPELRNGSEPFGLVTGVVATRGGERAVELGADCPVAGSE